MRNHSSRNHPWGDDSPLGSDQLTFSGTCLAQDQATLALEKRGSLHFWERILPKDPNICRQVCVGVHSPLPARLNTSSLCSVWGKLGGLSGLSTERLSSTLCHPEPVRGSVACICLDPARPYLLRKRAATRVLGNSATSRWDSPISILPRSHPRDLGNDKNPLLSSRAFSRLCEGEEKWGFLDPEILFSKNGDSGLVWGWRNPNTLVWGEYSTRRPSTARAVAQ